MKTHELLELASLDALGLLDDHEREAFEKAFGAAPPPVQAQIRREQARISRADQYLPEVEAPVSLRAKVLAAVHQAMEAVTGARRSAASFPSLLPSRGVSPVWRGTAIACAAAALVFGFAGLRIYSDVKDVNSYLQSNQWADAFKNMGPQFASKFLAADTQFVGFAPVAQDAGVKATARLMIDPKTRTGYLYLADLPKTAGAYKLVVVGANGQVGKALVSFEARSPIIEQTIPGMSLETDETLAIMSPSADPAKSVAILRTGNSQ